MKLQGFRQLLDFGGADEPREVLESGAPVSSGRERSRGASSDEAGRAAAPKSRARVMQLMDELDRLQSELDQANQRVVELETIADEDPLVPVLNRRSFLRELERTIAYASRYKTRVSLVYCDLDEFKSLNDRYGHAAGDQALNFFADYLVRSVRKSDLVGRLGGDEFAVILHYADEAAAAETADRLMADLAGLQLDYKGQKIAMSMSAGATEVGPDDGPEDVLERADSVMYEHKSRRKTETITSD